MRCRHPRSRRLTAGLILLGVLMIPALIPGRLAPYAPGETEALIVTEKEGETIFARPPFAPCARFPLGTDEWGRDLFSRLIYGSRNTLLLGLAVVMLSLLLALPVGLWAGWGAGPAGKVLDWLHSASGALPGLIVCLVVLRCGFLLKMPFWQSTLLYIAVISLTGWTSLAQSVRLQVGQVKQQPFIEGAIAAGATGGRIVRRHILPHLLPSLLSLGAVEMARTLLLIAQLGLFDIFVAGGHLEDIGVAMELVSDVPEWGQMLSDPIKYLQAAPWVPLVPAAAFALAVLTFHLLADGTYEWLQTRWGMGGGSKGS